MELKLKKFGIYSKYDDCFSVIIKIMPGHTLGIDYFPKEKVEKSNKAINDWLYTHFDQFYEDAVFDAINLNDQISSFKDSGYIGQIKNNALRNALSQTLDEFLEEIDYQY